MGSNTASGCLQPTKVEPTGELDPFTSKEMSKIKSKEESNYESMFENLSPPNFSSTSPRATPELLRKHDSNMTLSEMNMKA